MKYIKKWKVFENNWTKDEFIGDLTKNLGDFNLTPVYIRELIKKLDIEMEMESGKTPYTLSKELVKELELDDMGGYMNVYIPKGRGDLIKYL
jgi:hypothetical protein